MTALKGLLAVYEKRGGHSIHFNVFDPARLREAQAHPDRHRNLQVRVCGWNVRFNDMCAAEQDRYILRAENIAE